MEVKPICVIKLDSTLPMHNERTVLSELPSLRDVFQKEMPDYHVWVVPIMSNEPLTEPVQLQVFHPKDFTEANYEELKELVLTHIKEIKK